MMSTPAGDRIVALAVVVLGLALLAGASDVAFGVGYDRVGPRAFPYAVGLGLVALGVALVWSPRWRMLKGPRRRGRVLSGADATVVGEPRDMRFDTGPVLTVVAGLAGFVLLLDAAGFVAAATVQFVSVARAFKSRRLGQDVVTGLALAAVVYLGFTHGLGVVLPPGPFQLDRP